MFSYSYGTPMPHLEMSTPPGQHPPFSTVTSTDHSAWIIISSSLGLSITLLFSAIRVFVHTSTHHGYEMDDYLLAVATVLAVVQAILLLSGCADGLGKSTNLLDANLLASIQKKYYASNLLALGSLVPSRASILCFLLRLTPVISHRRLILSLLSTVAAWGVASFFAIALICNLSKPWVVAGEFCPGYFLRWQVLEICACVLEAAIFAASVWLVWGLKTSRKNKVAVIIAFSFRLLMIVIIALRLESFDIAGLAHDPIIAESEFASWTSAEMNYSIISATIPILRTFMSNLATNYGTGHGANDGGYGLGSVNSNSYSAARSKIVSSDPSSVELKQLPRASSRLSRVHRGGHVPTLRSDNDERAIGRHAKIKELDSGSIESDESQTLIIRKDISWQVRRDHAESGALEQTLHE